MKISEALGPFFPRTFVREEAGDLQSQIGEKIGVYAACNGHAPICLIGADGRLCFCAIESVDEACVIFALPEGGLNLNQP